MKKHFLILLISTLVILNSCDKQDYTSTDYLKAVLSNLEKIESATYTQIGEHWIPGDTVASGNYNSLVKEYNNPSDTTIGAVFIRLNHDDTTRLEGYYDGQMRALIYNDEKRIVLDDFTARPLPFRPVSPPFFNYVKSIIKYTIETSDSISLDIKDQIDFVYL